MKIFTIDNTVTLLLGTTAQENSQLVKEAKQNHYWFHLKSFPSPHLILQTDSPTKSLITQSAQLLKDNTKYKHIPTITIEYTQIKNVKLTSTPGQVLLKKTPNQIKI